MDQYQIAMLIISIVMYLLEAGIVALWIILNKKFGKITDGFKACFFIAVLAINVTNYWAVHIYQYLKFDISDPLYYFYSFGDAILSSSAGFGFQPKIEALLTVMEEVPYFAGSFILGLLLAAATTVAIFVSIFGRNLRNARRYFALRLRSNKDEGIDYVIGAGDIEKNYYRTHKSCVLLVSTDFSNEERANLLNDGYIVINSLDEDFENIFKIAKRFPNKKHNFVLFDDSGEDKFRPLFSAFLKSTEPKDNIFLHLEVSSDKVEYFRSQIDDSKFNKYHINLFNRYEIMGNDMCYEDPITKYLPSDFINDDTTIKDEKQINIFVIGFGRMNKEIYKKLVINNQYVQKDGNFFKSHPVHYYIFDSREANKYCYIYEGVQDLYDRLNEAEFDPKTKKRNNVYFELPEKVNIAEFDSKTDVNSSAFLHKINDISKDKNSANYFFISHGDDYVNVELARKINENITNKEFHIWVRIDEDEYRDPALINTSYFGRLKDYLVHNKVVDYEAHEIAIKVEEAYDNTKKTKEELFKREYLKVFSNYCQIMNLRHKLNLLGYDFVKKEDVLSEDTLISEEELKTRIGVGSIKEYKDYKAQTITNAIIYEEHLHWNSLYILSGFEPMPVKDHIVEYNSENKPSIKTKDFKKKQHGAIASHMGLDERFKFIDSLKKSVGIKEDLFNTDIDNPNIYTTEEYKYDYKYIKDCHKYLSSQGFVVIKKRDNK